MWFQWGLVAPHCPKTLPQKGQVRWGIGKEGVPSVLALSWFLIGVTVPCPGRMLRAAAASARRAPRSWQGGKGIPGWKWEAESSSAVTASARGTQLGEGWGRGGERTRGATGHRKPSGWHLTLTRGSHPCWSAVMLLKPHKRT